jgi:hypothetical protein
MTKKAVTPAKKDEKKPTEKTTPRYEPPKLTRFEKLERLIIAGE